MKNLDKYDNATRSAKNYKLLSLLISITMLILLYLDADVVNFDDVIFSSIQFRIGNLWIFFILSFTLFSFCFSVVPSVNNFIFLVVNVLPEKLLSNKSLDMYRTKYKSDKHCKPQNMFTVIGQHNKFVLHNAFFISLYSLASFTAGILGFIISIRHILICGLLLALYIWLFKCFWNNDTLFKFDNLLHCFHATGYFISSWIFHDTDVYSATPGKNIMDPLVFGLIIFILSCSW